VPESSSSCVDTDGKIRVKGTSCRILDLTAVCLNNLSTVYGPLTFIEILIQVLSMHDVTNIHNLISTLYLLDALVKPEFS
jgi:hypothetical protein